MKHINIPIFIPHLGCPNQCIFCNQKHISGKTDFKEENVRDEILKVLSTVTDEECEIAFFGGSFTGIDRALMIRMLDLAQEFVNNGKVSGIRMSTRPDYISSEIISVISSYNISCVELGIQTMNDETLCYLKRGHTKQDTANAISLLNNAKIPFVGQMMIGLPHSSLEDELECAEFIAKNNAVGARIYPTLVFKHTDLAQMFANGEYIAISEEEAVERSARVLNVFNEHAIPCIRIGLCDSDNLHSTESFVAGPNNPAMGEMVKSRVFYNSIVQKIESNKELQACKSIIIKCPKGKISQIIGLKKENINKIKSKFEINNVKVLEDETLKNFDIYIEKGGTRCV